MINAVRHDIGKTLDQDAMNRVGNEDIVSTAVARITDALCISLSKRLKRCEPESESLVSHFLLHFFFKLSVRNVYANMLSDL